MGNLSDRPQNRYISQKTINIRKAKAYLKSEVIKMIYYENPTLCLFCGNSILFAKRLTHKFCSSSCSASYNNKGVRRHGCAPNNCIICGSLTANAGSIFCSPQCAGKNKQLPDDHKRKMRAAGQARYRAKELRRTDPSANQEKINEIYRNCPSGYHVDHIIPLSLGGKHHEDNLQYLTPYENRSKNNRWIG